MKQQERERDATALPTPHAVFITVEALREILNTDSYVTRLNYLVRLVSNHSAYLSIYVFTFTLPLKA